LLAAHGHLSFGMSDSDAPPARHPRQNQLLALAGVLIVVAVALVLVVTLRGGSDGPASGSPDAVTDSLAAALRAHDSGKIADTACRSARAAVARGTRGVVAGVVGATRHGSAQTQGALAVAQIAVTTASGSANATVALRSTGGAWCVASFAVALPTKR
jgi:hypothetical protein